MNTDYVIPGSGGSLYFDYTSAAIPLSEANATVTCRLSPDPVRSTSMFMLYGVSHPDRCRLYLYNIQGKERSRVSLDAEGGTVIDRGELAAGRYFYRVVEGDQVVAGGSFAVE